MQKRLTVILGAGSSYDCVTPNVAEHNTDYRPPLTEELFAFRRSFNAILRKYPKAEALSDRIRTRLTARDSLEDLLRSLEEERNLYLKKRYYAIPLYLQELLGEVSAHYVQGATKFDTLVGSLEGSSYEKVMYLTLNYDLFLETALRRLYRIALSVPRHYLGEGFKWSLVKLHGSVNWGKKLLNPVSSRNSAEILDELTEELHLDPAIHVLDGWQEDARRVQNSFYAITVPLKDKDEFVCPEEHSGHAEEFLRGCTDFLVIGFSALDGHVLKLLKVVPRVQKLIVVNENKPSAMETLGRLVKVNKNFDLFPAGREKVAAGFGFARFIDEGKLATFLEI